MAMIGIESTAGVLIATDYNGSAESYPIAQDIDNYDFAILKDIEVKLEFESMSDSSSVADLLRTYDPIGNGDNLVIVKDDDSVHGIVASGVMIVYVDMIPLMTSNTDPVGVASASSEENVTTRGVWNLMNKDTSTRWSTAIYTPVPVQVQYEFDVSTKTSRYSIRSYDSPEYARFPKDWRLLGSEAGTFTGEETIIDVQTNQSVSSPLERKEYTFASEVSFKFYRLDISENNGDINYTSFSEFTLDRRHYAIDTGAITAGEIPTRVYSVDAQISFNDGEGYLVPVYTGDSYDVTALPTFKSTRTYEDLNIQHRRIQTKVELKNKGTKCTKISANIWEGG